MLITWKLRGIWTIFQVVSSLRTMPARLCITPKKLEPYTGSLHLGQIRPHACPLGRERIQTKEDECAANSEMCVLLENDLVFKAFPNLLT